MCTTKVIATASSRICRSSRSGGYPASTANLFNVGSIVVTSKYGTATGATVLTVN